MTQTLIYTPGDPAGVTSVDRLRLYTTSTRTDPPTLDTGPATLLPDGRWRFAFPDVTDGTYYASITVTYEDGLTADDTNDVVTLPAPTPAQGSEPRALWVTTDELGTIEGATGDQLTAAVTVASEVLFALSGRRWHGRRTDRLRVAPLLAGLHVPFPSSFTLWTSGRTRGCACHSSRIDPGVPGPVTRVASLLLGDTSVPVEQITVEDRHIIRVQPGADSTTDPLAVNLWVDEDGYYALFPNGACSCGRTATVEMVVEWGTPPPAAGAAAALALAQEIAQGLTGGSCRIAGNVTSVNRQGVSVLLDPNEYLKEGRTGVPLVDLWLTSVNPNKLARESEVWWPEADAAVRLG